MDGGPPIEKIQQLSCPRAIVAHLTRDAVLVEEEVEVVDEVAGGDQGGVDQTSGRPIEATITPVVLRQTAVAAIPMEEVNLFPACLE